MKKAIGFVTLNWVFMNLCLLILDEVYRDDDRINASFSLAEWNWSTLPRRAAQAAPANCGHTLSDKEGAEPPDIGRGIHVSHHIIRYCCYIRAGEISDPREPSSCRKYPGAPR
jgi:hypothetical protein